MIISPTSTTAVAAPVNSIFRPDAEAISHSLSITLSADRKTPLTDAQVTAGKRVTEQDCYSALIHQGLSATSSKLAARFEKELKAATETFKKSHGKVNMHKVSDRLVRQYVREKELSQQQYQKLRDHAFGLSQLDSDRTRISAERLPDAKSGDTPLRAVSTFHKKLETNKAASAEEIAQFRANEAAISVEKWREKKKAGILGVPAGTAVLAHGEAQSLSVTNLPNGFLWKPQSDSDGKLVVLLPPSLTTTVHSLSIKDAKGDKIIETGRFSGIANGGRLHFRFTKSGGAYPDNATVEVTLVDGNVIKIPIKETAARIES